ncbi:MAG: alpha-ketoglutarate-dependent dioxygenase AlkB [Pseudomonadota bacterium]
MRDGVVLYKNHLDRAAQVAILDDVRACLALAPFYHPSMPRTGRPLSVRMTNCGPLGWVADKTGYRYQPLHPETEAPWPAIPASIMDVWHAVSGFAHPAQACLVNHYTQRAKLGLHKDSDEEHVDAPVVSVSLGDDAVFAIGGLKRADPKERVTLTSGDVLVFGGASRLIYHGIDRIKPGTSDLLSATGIDPAGGRLNLTLRHVSYDI